MRYGACTEADVKLLRSRVVGRAPDRPKLSDPKFHHVSIITSYSAHRDKINKVHSKHFAEEAGLKLQEFYSNDKWKPDSKHDKKGKKRNIHEVDPQRKSNEINPYLKDTLWSLPHACSEIILVCSSCV